jgi:periplasmic protein TonB
MQPEALDITDQFTTCLQATYFRTAYALIGAALLNLCLFTLMPALINRTTEVPVLTDVVPDVHLVRLMPREQPKQQADDRAEPEPPPEPKQKPDSPKQLIKRLSLSFDLSPRLPGKPSGLVLSPPDTALAFDSGAGDLFSAGDLDTPMTIIARTPPLYPLRARQRGTQGWVSVRLLVDEQGNVADVSILAAQPVGIFEESVRRCVRKWRFSPGTVEGQPVKVQVDTTINFELE